MNNSSRHVPVTLGTTRIGCAIVLALSGLTSCSTTQHTAAPVMDRLERTVRDGDETYTVKKGDTLYSIAFRTGHDYRDLAAWNAIAPPYTIYVGQTIRLVQGKKAGGTQPPVPPNVVIQPLVRRNVEIPPAPSANAAPRPPAPTPPKAAVEVEKTPASHVEVPGETVAAFENKWEWPLRGRVIKQFSESGSKGIDIVGADGQAVAAAAPGKVVYSGQGLIGYGNLVIIKHSDTYLSAYGNNKRLLVDEGDSVRSGQAIAEIGRLSRRMPMLHFEIRKDGKPVDPLEHLPAR